MKNQNIINHPPHYLEGRTIEPINVIESWALCHHLACVVKYVARAGRKNPIWEDLRKAEWYLGREVKNLQEPFGACSLSFTKSKPLKPQDVCDDWQLSENLGKVLGYISLAVGGLARKEFASGLSVHEVLDGREQIVDDVQSFKSERCDDSWLFICSTTSQRESLRSLMTSWISIAISAVMETIPDEKRRVWLIIDELSSLHKVGELPKAAAEFRKYGGCLVVGMQNIKQIQDLYGAHLSESLMSLFNTKIFFRAPEATTAQWVSKTLGEQEVSESIENISYGAHQMRDGVSLNDQRRTKPTVAHSEILTLPSLTAFLKLPAEIPVTKITFKYVEREIVGPAFVGRE